MGFFSVLDHTANHPTYAVEACHLNVWSLKGLFGHRPMLLDVGLRIHASAEVKQIELVVPVATVARVVNLSGLVMKTDVARLLFGRHLERLDDHTLHMVNQVPATIVNIDDNGSVLNTDYRSHGLTVVTLKLTSSVQAGETAYARARLVVDHAGAMWRWNRAVARRNGALIDLRVPDPREGGASPELPALYERAIKLNRLDVFVMLPERFQLRASNPRLEYTRTLESRAWKPYLRRSATGPLRRERLMVHRWKVNGASDAVPFRGFLQFARHPPLHSITDHAITALAAVVLAFLLLRNAAVRPEISQSINVVADQVWSTLGVVLISGVGLFGVLWTAVPKLRHALSIYPRLKRQFKKLEYHWFEVWR